MKDLSEALPKNFFCHFLVIALRAKIPYWLMGCPQVVILNEVKDLSKALAEEFLCIALVIALRAKIPRFATE